MTRSFARLAWTATALTYLLIILGAIVRITGSGLGCGEHWPLCHSQLLPPLDLPTLIEYAHRLAAALVSALVVALAGYAWRLRRYVRSGMREGGCGKRVPGAPDASRIPHPASRSLHPEEQPGVAAYAAVALLVLQVGLGALTVKLALPPWTVILHLGTAMLLLATLIVAAREPYSLAPGLVVVRGAPGLLTPRASAGIPGLVAVVLGFVTVLLGALTANLGAATACLGFPLCNGQLLPHGNSLQLLQWTHRLLAYTLFGYVVWWAVRSRRGWAWAIVALVTLQVGVAAAMVLLALPQPLQALHAAIGTGVWAGLVAAIGGRGR